MDRALKRRTPDVALRLFLAAAAVVCALAVPRTAFAYAWMIRHGEMHCANCHADPSGGGLLTKYGRQSGYDLLSTPWGTFGNDDTRAAPEQTSPPLRTGWLWGAWDTPEWLLLGGSLRGAAFTKGGLRIFPMQLDLTGQLKVGRLRAGGSLGVARLKQNSSNGRETFVTANQGNDFNLLSRTHWIALDLGEKKAFTLRAGRLDMPFGLRIVEHATWVREITRTDHDADQQHGVALAYTGSRVRTEVMGIAGNFQIRPDSYRERGYSGYLEYFVNDAVGVGVSSLLTHAAADRVSFEREDTTRGVHGAFVRARLIQPLVLMAEVDTTHISRRDPGYVAFAQLDYEVIQGLHGIVSVELLDQGSRHAPQGIDPPPTVAGAGSPRVGGWLSIDWFFYRQLDLRVDLMLRQDMGANVLAQLHAYL